MEVLLTHEAFAPDFAGGGEYVVLEMARTLIRNNVRVRVLTTGNPAETSFEGIPTARLPIHKFRFNLAVREIARHARGADVIQTCTYHACLPSLVAGKLLQKPVVCLVLGLFQDAWKEMRPGIGGAGRVAWEKFLLRRDFSRIVFISDYSRQLGVELGAPAQRSIVNFPGVRLEDYTADGPKEDIVLFVGKLDVRKGITDFLATAARLPEVRFQAMGWGENYASFRAQASPNVEFPRFERGPALAAAFSRARICLLPSRAETFGVALVEAMASGCAIISSIPLPFEGVRVEPGNVTAMTDAVRALLGDPAETARKGRRNAELARQYTWDRFAANLIATYEEILAKEAV
jgi:glycosyltransferase involved in cell wall biosynthesis